MKHRRMTSRGRLPGRRPSGVDRCAVGLLLAFAFLPLACDLDWKEQAEAAVRLARRKELSGHYDTALRLYRKALELNPYDETANYKMGELYETRFFQEPNAAQRAVHYYRRYLDLRPRDRKKRKFIETQCLLLQKIVDGVIEDPAFATQDLIDAATANSIRAFSKRLHDAFVAALIRNYKTVQAVNRFLDRWNRQAQPGWRLTYRDIRKNRDQYHAMIIIKLADGRRRKLRFLLGDTNAWELAADESVPDKQ